MIEVWKKIEDFPIYEVSNFGRVRRKAITTSDGRRLPMRMKKVYLNNGTAYAVSLRTYMQNKSISVSRLVYKTFKPNDFKDTLHVYHYDEDISNCKLDNLYQCEKYPIYKKQYGIHLSKNRENLKLASPSKIKTKPIKSNTSGVSGVTYVKKYKRWVARIGVNNKNINLGSYKNKKDAVKARKNAEKLYAK